MCERSSRVDYTFDGSGLTFTTSSSAPPGAILQASVRVTQGAQSSIEPAYTRSDAATGTTPAITVSFPVSCIPDIEVETTYYVVANEDSSAPAFSCEVTQSFVGETEFAIQAPTIDLAGGSCAATGLVVR